MKIHLHTVCWNDGFMLDYFFRHYHWVDHFFIDDDGSTDGSLEKLAARPDVTVRRLHRANPDSWVDSARRIYDSFWKRSRGEADWVIVTNIDEHVHHPDMRGYLAAQQAAGVTAVTALGYQMISDDFPASDALLWRDHPRGAPWRMMSKLALWRPDRIDETQYAPGRHKAVPTGEVVYPDRDEVVNFHYKYLGVAHTHDRMSAQNERLGAGDRAEGWGHQYAWTREQLDDAFERFRARLVDTRAADHHNDHTEPRWWRPRRAERFFARRPRSASWRLDGSDPGFADTTGRFALHPAEASPVPGDSYVRLAGNAETRGGLFLPVLDSAVFTLALGVRYDAGWTSAVLAGNQRPGSSQGGWLLGAARGVLKLRTRDAAQRLALPADIRPGDILKLSVVRDGAVLTLTLWRPGEALPVTARIGDQVGNLLLAVGNALQPPAHHPQGIALTEVHYADRALTAEAIAALFTV